MKWKFHDSYKTPGAARKYGETVVKCGLAKGVKIVPNGKKSRPYLLYILPTQN